MMHRVVVPNGFSECFALCLALSTGCIDSSADSEEASQWVQARQALTFPNGQLEPGEACDDGNAVTGDGCDALGRLEGTYHCWVSGSSCSPSDLCGNSTLDSGETCVEKGALIRGCSEECDLTECGDGLRQYEAYPSSRQESCDDGNRYDGDGCNRRCEVEIGFACTGSPSRCLSSGVVFYNTGVGNDRLALPEGARDPHWRYTFNDAPAVVHFRAGADWPNPLHGAAFLTSLAGSSQGNGYGCVYQDFQIPSTYVAARFSLVIAAFNAKTYEDDEGQYFARVNGVVAEWGTGIRPVGAPAVKTAQSTNGIYVLTEANPWVNGANRVELCHEDSPSSFMGFRYVFMDATDDVCGNGTVSEREQCDDDNAEGADGCSASCELEAGYGCVGSPSQCAVTCGNDALNPGEECDDGARRDLDGCSSGCRLETGYVCPTTGFACQKTCGDGHWLPGEGCDDGNRLAGDGCSPTCQVSGGWECFGSLGGKAFCQLRCGNGRLEPGELCDDGNRLAGDGCSPGCTAELGYACGPSCAATCGNGKVDASETCDDGKLDPGDGCSAECTLEPGWVRVGPRLVKLVTCGDGLLNRFEDCDDKNTVNGDGCDASCQVESGYVCRGVPSICWAICGDARVSQPETCDDGNGDASDGCGETCRTERGFVCHPSSGAGPSSCAPTCGNDVLEPGEQCDDGGVDDGDGCGATCLEEPGWRCLGAFGPCVDICGDGLRTPGEYCDDGNLSDADACDASCALTGTGNGPPRLLLLDYRLTEGLMTPLALVAIDPESEALGYAIAGGDDARMFSLDSDLGWLALTSPADFEHPLDLDRDNEYRVSVRVTDSAGNSDTQSIRVRIEDRTEGAKGDSCVGDGDCRSLVCDANTATCFEPSCSDVAVNGSETDVDCGGDRCSRCAAGSRCIHDDDCLSNYCWDAVCVLVKFGLGDRSSVGGSTARGDGSTSGDSGGASESGEAKGGALGEPFNAMPQASREDDGCLCRAGGSKPARSQRLLVLMGLGLFLRWRRRRLNSRATG